MAIRSGREPDRHSDRFKLCTDRSGSTIAVTNASTFASSAPVRAYYQLVQSFRRIGHQLTRHRIFHVAP